MSLMPSPRVAASCVAGALCAASLSLRVAASSVADVASSVAHLAAEHAHAHSRAQGANERSVFGWWEVIQHGSRAELLSLLSPRWWVHYVAREFEAEPAHVILEIACLLTIIYLLVLRKPAPVAQEKLSAKEEEELIREWKPEPLCPALPPSRKTRFVVESATGRTLRANGGQTFINFAANNFLGLANRADTKVACRDTIDKYGVGSCGPRGFYGTFDVHLEVEAAVASFLGAEEAILYSDAIACVSSLIPAFAKKGDVIVVDESCSFGIQQGCLLSRSDVHYYRHNDMDDLEAVLASLDAKEKAQRKKKGHTAGALHRKFIVLEGVSSIDGSIAPLPRVLALKKKFQYRVLMDDSLGFGTLGATGKGTLEHFGLPIDSFDAVCAAMDNALGSVGGFCVGNHMVVDHQRLSGAGYCFSASSPPYTSTASLHSLAIMRAQPELTTQLQAKAVRVRKALANVHRKLVVLGGKDSEQSPVIHLALSPATKPSRGQPVNPSDRALLEALHEALLSSSSPIVCSVPEFIPADHAARLPTLRISLSVQHTDADLDALVKAITQAAQEVLSKH